MSPYDEAELGTVRWLRPGALSGCYAPCCRALARAIVLAASVLVGTDAGHRLVDGGVEHRARMVGTRGR